MERNGTKSDELTRGLGGKCLADRAEFGVFRIHAFAAESNGDSAFAFVDLGDLPVEVLRDGRGRRFDVGPCAFQGFFDFGLEICACKVSPFGDVVIRAFGCDEAFDKRMGLWLLHLRLLVHRTLLMVRVERTGNRIDRVPRE